MFGCDQAQVSLDFLADVAQAGRYGYAALNRKCQAMGLASSVVWVLAQDADFHVLYRSQMQGGEDVVWVDVRLWSANVVNVPDQCAACRRCGKAADHRFPAVWNEVKLARKRGGLNRVFGIG